MAKVIHIDGGGSGGGSGIGWDGQVEFRANLPITLGVPPIGSVWLVLKPTTLLGITTYQSGLYMRDSDTGSLTDWRRLNIANPQNIKSVLTVGNFVGDGQTIVAENGSGVLNLRDGADDTVTLYSVNSGVKVYGALGVVSFGNNVDTLNDLTSEVYISNFGSSLALYNNNISINKTGLVGLIYNETFSWNFDADLPNYPTQMGCQKGDYKIGVTNSGAFGGFHTVVKTNNTGYVNQLGFNVGGLFETILGHTVATADRTQTLQDKDGIIALLGDIPVVNWIPQNIPLGSLLTNGASFFINGGAGVYLSFNGSSDDEVFFNDTLSTTGNIYDGSDLAIKLHCRISSNGVVGDNVGLILNYAIIKDGDNSSTTVTNVAQVDYDVSTELQDVEFDIQLTTMIGVVGGENIMITLTRNSLGQGADSYGGNLEVTGLEFIKL